MNIRALGQVSETRRYDLDWIRIAVFGLLILFHVGMFYVPWGWHVKSPHAPVDALRLPMVLSGGWRIPALFFISGVALRFALDKGAPRAGFLWRRTGRIMLPVLFGMAVVCAPQAYLELKGRGIDPGEIWSFWMNYLAPPWSSPKDWPVITPTWNHLWYLVYLFLFTLVLVGAFAPLRARLDRAMAWASDRPMVIFTVPATVGLVLLWLFQDSLGAVQIVWGDWYRLAAMLWTMGLGFAVAKVPSIWAWLWRARWYALCAALITGALLVVLERVELSSGWAYYYITRTLYGWCALYALFGWGQALGRGSDRMRTYLADAVFPYYVLHQTITIMLGVWLGGFSLPLGAEAGLLILGTGVGCAVIYHVVIRRMGRAAILFGGRPNPR